MTMTKFETNVYDIADYILRKQGPMSAMKLQKLVYYAQAWSLAWTDTPLFNEDIQAWARGPVVPALYYKHKTCFSLSDGFFGGSPDKVSSEQQEVIYVVLQFYGNKDPQWLSDLTHLESPWKDARAGLAPDERGNSVITKEAMLEYYGSL
jgi:uncharacterized phage-associated protein